MSCCNGRNRSPGITVKNRLVFLRKELIYDIENYAFVAGDILPEDAEHIRHQLIDVAQEGNVDLVTRILNLAHAECVESLYPYAKKPCGEGDVYDDKLAEPERYEIELELPEQFSRTSVDLLKELIHDYFVVRVLGQWTGVVNPAGQAYWKMCLEEITERMRRVLMNRRKPLRRKQSMF